MFNRKLWRWTVEEERQMLEMRAAGRSVISIAKALKQTPAAVSTKLTKQRGAGQGKSPTPPGLQPMDTFNPSEPAILRDRLTAKIETWTGEHAADYRQTSVASPDGTVKWREFVFDGWGNVLGG